MNTTTNTYSADRIFASLDRVVHAGAALLLVGVLSACGGGSSPASAPTPAPPSSTAAIGDANVAAIYIDGGPSAGTTIPNSIFADVKVCALNSTVNCAIIDHVLVDTGSVGLRLMAEAVPTSLLTALPPVNTSSGVFAGECLAFASGVSWGGLRSADVHIGGVNFNGQVASGIPVQIIADPDARLATIPSGCQGTMMQTVAALGANGILGIGLFDQDCGSVCAPPASPSNVYFACASAGACARTTMPLAKQVSNPIVAFASDNNGNAISLPALPGGSASRADGMLIFGIHTRLNNALAAGSAVLGADSFTGYFQSVFNGNTLPNSFIDSGSSINFFPAQGTHVFATCSAPYPDFFCPASSITLTAANTGGAASSSLVPVLTINAAPALNSNNSAILGLAGPSGGIDSLDLGASFFFGRTVTTLIENRSAVGFSIVGPAFAHTP
jgi:hypothetical protein